MRETENCNEEIIQAVKLCDTEGGLELSSLGWSRYPFHDCSIGRSRLRIKKWDYWSITDDRYFFTVAITDMGYIKTAFLYILDKENNTLLEKCCKSISQSSCILSDRVYGYSYFKNSSTNIEFLKQGDSIAITANCKSFKRGMLKAQFEISIPKEQESLNVVIPWDKKRFHFTSKQNCLTAKGKIGIGDNIIEFDREKTLASLDYGRGVWPYNSYWNWASCSSIQNGVKIGFNLGGGWTDGTGSNENAVYIDNVINKLTGDALFEYDKSDKLKPWKISTNESNRIELIFTPSYHRIARYNALIIKSELHQIFGTFSGTICLKDGKVFNIDNLYGCVEEHNARW